MIKANSYNTQVFHITNDSLLHCELFLYAEGGHFITKLKFDQGLENGSIFGIEVLRKYFFLRLFGCFFMFDRLFEENVLIEKK